MREGTIREIERDREIGTTLIGLATFYRATVHIYILYSIYVHYTVNFTGEVFIKIHEKKENF